MHIPSIIFCLLFTGVLSIAQAQPSASHQHEHSSTCQHDHAHSASADHANSIGATQALFLKNKNQWHDNILYKSNLSGIFNSIYVEKNRLTYQMYDQTDLDDLHALKDSKEPINLKGHSYHVNFKNSLEANVIPLDIKSRNFHYFLGNNPEKWATNVPAASAVLYENLYKNIDLKVLKKHDNFKYEFIVQPGANPNDILIEYEGVESVVLDNEMLKIQTSVAQILEHKPYTYQIIDGKEREIPSSYLLKDNELRFIITGEYDKNLPLVIDPTVVAATLTGHNISGSAGVFGHTATFDSEGNIYTGGLAFGAGYVVTTGAFDQTFNGDEDMVLTKFNPTGTQMIYATYVGGNNSDYPNSIITDFSQRLYVYGSTLSNNFPVTGNAYQTDHAGASDIVVVVLNPDGSALEGSTYLGGTATDGVNVTNVDNNYGDDNRGEIVLDAQNNIYICSGTRSDDFPIFNGFDSQFNDQSETGFAQDAVVAKLNNDLSVLYWSTYLGGSNQDYGAGLRLDDENNVYVTGFAGANDFPTTNGTVMSNYPGGEQSAFVVKIGKNGDELLLGTFWGTGQNDRGYFIDIDEENNVHIYGYSKGDIQITPGAYFNVAGSPQFLTAFTPNLDELVYSTVIGTSTTGSGYDFFNNDIDFVPVAFMVDKCNNIYFSGYGAADGLPTTTGSLWNSGDSFYLGVLEPNAEALSFATYYGRSNHVDGGTSRFDKSGIVYQAVCSCTNNGSNNAMITNPNAFETNMPAATCDVGVFKIDFDIETVTAAGVIFESGTNVVSSSGCAPFDVDFLYTGEDATSFYWNFGDGDDSTLENPSHTYQEAGSYEVFLVAENPLTCNQIDTVFLYVDVLDNTNVSTNTSFCEGGDNLFLDASVQNALYTWQDGFTGSTYLVQEPGTYWVNIDIGGCARTDTFLVNPFVPIELPIDDVVVACDVNSYTFDAEIDGITSYTWQDGTTGPNYTSSVEGNFTITTLDENNCSASTTVQLLFGETPSVDLGADVILCDGQSFTADVTFPNPNVTYTWSNGDVGPNFSTTVAGTYTVVLSDDGCEATDDVTVEFHPEFNLNPEIVPVQCNDDCNASITVAGTGGGGGLSYLWNTGSTDLVLNNLCAGDYSVTVSDNLDCEYVTDFPLINPDVLELNPDWQDLICAGDGSGVISGIATVGGIEPYSFSLNGGNFVSSTEFTNLDAGVYSFSVLDSVGCLVSTEVTVTQPPEFFVEAGEDQSLELGESTSLEGDVFPLFGQEIEWTSDEFLDCTDCLTPELTPTRTITYTLTATDPNTGCFRDDEVTVEVIKIRKVYIPNAFSPNNDGVNDQFELFAHIGVSEILELKIFDRWGGLVFESLNFPPNKPGFGWDGTVRDKPVNSGVFAYYARVRYLDGEIGLFKGDVTVVR